ncbi:hypothetical protein EUGRSUZ_B00836 [Eucalyptus grandis]|uniref:Uncharacterized protein n=2 Tax=Eucalyptus grandis TaxID=71139 RepID=A0A059D0P1_EUCGR|nr:hypothetical protein EUGRSUZ_B00836 [Eucalyptus grandis]
MKQKCSYFSLTPLVISSLRCLQKYLGLILVIIVCSYFSLTPLVISSLRYLRNIAYYSNYSMFVFLSHTFGNFIIEIFW